MLGLSYAYATPLTYQSSLLTLGSVDASITLPSLNRSLIFSLPSPLLCPYYCLKVSCFNFLKCQAAINRASGVRILRVHLSLAVAFSN